MKAKLFTIPNLVTLLNMFCGMLALYYLYLEEVRTAYIFLGIALIADFLDGTIARALNQGGPIGKELDSLADVVSFGVFPGFMLFQLMSKTNVGSIEACFVGLLISLAAALRLAKFNVSTDQSKEFKGLNTPTMTIGIFGLHAAYFLPEPGSMSYSYPLLVAIAVLVSFLMISNIDMLSFKIDAKNRGRTGIQLVIILTTVISYFVLGYIGFTIGILSYILLSWLYFRIIQKP